MNSEIKNILNNLNVNDKNIPVSHLRYKGNSKTYVTWAIIGETPELMANSQYLYSVVALDVDVFSDGNYSSIMKEIKKRFIDSDWVWVEDSQEMYEDDTQLYHRTITFEKEKEISNG